MPLLRVIWKTKGGLLVCPTCRSLEGFSWFFECEKGEKFPNPLIHPTLGPVYSKEGSLIVESNGHKCRRVLKVDVDLNPFIQQLKQIRENLSTTRSQKETTKKQYR